ncbi:Tyrosine-protein kinase wzc [Mariniflexile rhizosphaerae]|uniref:GumC family protein n=1 Tax=unclassified Mariniflexile TaxID=2643887 RepID=UPI000CC1A1F2|nr:polysaccharide biosynthesis tyrosine autokinase [Mariniflexile sp. TRM1-10]AXP82477.1 Tyrosine-protein kinase wzc [Mariniflexile sp. TRM1-10]PLB17805.1 MAG: Capsular exopolysaccharide family protein [Flavobacteriaceae bacterium FS1-H7996/R]
MSDLNNSSKIDSANQFNFKKAASIYVKRWFWFVLSISIFLGIAYFNLRYTAPEYSATAKIMLVDDGEATGASAVFKDLPFFAEKEDAKVEDEMSVIMSRAFFSSITKDLRLNIKHYSKGRIYDSEIYKNAPITISFIASDSIIDRINFSFYIKILSDKEFEYRVNENDDPKNISFGEKIPTSFGGMIITPSSSKLERSIVGAEIRTEILPVKSIAESLRNRIQTYQENKSSRIINISIQDPIIERAKDIINTLIAKYNEATINQKNIKATNTAKFIDERIELIAKDLLGVDDSIVRFKTGNKVMDVTSEAGQFLTSSVQNEQDLELSRMQLRQLNYMDSALGDTDSYTPIPSNLGLGDPTIVTLSSKYNELIVERERLLKSAGERNSVVLQLNQNLRSIKENLSRSIQNSKKSLGIQISSLENQSNILNSRIFSVPGQESKLRSIERKQGIKESLYLYLLQKREEAAITLTATSPSSKVVELAYSSGSPVAPNKKMIYIGALFLGFLIPFGFIYVEDLLDTKIHNKEDLESEIKNITILGEIPKVKKVHKEGEGLLVEKNDRSVLSESFRIIRTNFDYVRRGRNVGQYDNVVFVTSTINGEGKSFFSLNMALTMANTNKRVLLIGADIRNPKIHSIIKKQVKTNAPDVGLTEFLVDKSILAGETINTFTVNDIKLDILFSGKIPPNPAELLMTERVKEIFDYASTQYDMVIVDTAPAMLVTDTLLLSDYAGHTIYLTRAGYTEKKILSFTKELHATKKLKGMMLVVNNVSQENFGYGARYGYYNAPEKKGFFKRIFR